MTTFNSTYFSDKVADMYRDAYLDELKREADWMSVVCNKENYPMTFTLGEDLSYTIRRSDGEPFVTLGVDSELRKEEHDWQEGYEA